MLIKRGGALQAAQGGGVCTRGVVVLGQPEHGEQMADADENVRRAGAMLRPRLDFTHLLDDRTEHVLKVVLDEHGIMLDAASSCSTSPIAFAKSG